MNQPPLKPTKTKTKKIAIRHMDTVVLHPVAIVDSVTKTFDKKKRNVALRYMDTIIVISTADTYNRPSKTYWRTERVISNC